MPRSEITLAFVGSGAVEKKNATGLLRDWIDGNGGNVKAVLPMTKEHWNPSLGIVAEFLVASDIPIEAIVDDTTAKMRELKPYLTVARKQYQSTAVPHKIAAVLSEAHDARLVVLWDDEDDNVHDTVREVDKAGGIVLLDLTDGLDRIDLQSEEGEEEEFEEPASDEVPDAEEEAEEDESEDDGEEFSTEDGENEEESEEDDGEVEADADAEDDLDEEAEDDEGDEEFPGDDDEEEFQMPEEDEENVLTELMETEAGPMTEFQGKLIALLERVVVLLERESAPAASLTAAVEKAAPAAKPAAKKAVAAPVKRAVKPAPKPAAKPATKKVAPPVKRTVKPAAKAAAPAKKTATKPVARASSNGKMTKAQAQKIMDEYRPRRGRPPAEVTEARAVLGL